MKFSKTKKCSLVISNCNWRHSMEFTNDTVFALYRISLFFIPSNIRPPSMSLSMLCKYGFTTKEKEVKMHKYLSIGFSFIYYFCICLHENCYYSDLTGSGRMCITNSSEQRQYIQILGFWTVPSTKFLFAHKAWISPTETRYFLNTLGWHLPQKKNEHWWN